MPLQCYPGELSSEHALAVTELVSLDEARMLWQAEVQAAGSKQDLLVRVMVPAGAVHSRQGVGNMVSNALEVVVDVLAPTVRIAAGRTEHDPVYNALVTPVTFTFSEPVVPTGAASKVALTRVELQLRPGPTPAPGFLSLSSFAVLSPSEWVVGVRAEDGVSFGVLLAGGAAVGTSAYTSITHRHICTRTTH